MTTKTRTKVERKNEQMTVKVEKELKGELEAIAQKEDRTLAQIARIALKEFVQRQKETVAA
jgi:predicted transcriptional regulator